MQPDSAPSLALPTPGLRKWQAALGSLGLAWAAIAALTAREWGEMLHQWTNIDTYNHILIVPVIIVWLVALRRDQLARMTPEGWWPGLFAVCAALALWTAGRISGINLLAHAGTIAAMQACVLAVLGPRVALVLALPLGFAVFLVPFGDEIIAPLQLITAQIAVQLTHWSGVAATLDGINIDTPAGLFIVAEACSGVKFLIAMVAIGALVSATSMTSWRRRALLMGACVIVPVLANGVRAWGTIYLAQIFSVEFAKGMDHIIYGWIFFALVLGAVLMVAWRFFEREPEDAGFSASEADAIFARVSFAPRAAAPLRPGLAIVLLVALWALAMIYAPGSIG